MIVKYLRLYNPKWQSSIYSLDIRRFTLSTTQQTGETMVQQHMKNAADIVIPKERLQCSFCRSSGPGGQNVNKTNSKAEIRFMLKTADWMSEKVRSNLVTRYGNHINKDGEFILTSQVYKAQDQNLKAAIEKLRQMVLECSQPEKNQFIIPPPTERMQQVRVQNKRIKSDVKKLRQTKWD